MDDGTGADGSLSRRALIRRGAVVGGIVWAAPVLQSMTNPAFAAGSQAPGDPCTAAYFVKYQLPTKEHRGGVWSGSEGSSRGCKPPGYDQSIRYKVKGNGYTKSRSGVIASTATIGGTGRISAVYDPRTHCLTITAPDGCRLFQVIVKKGGHCVPVPLTAPYPQSYQLLSGGRAGTCSYVSMVLCCN